MTVERSYYGDQTTYTLRHVAAESCALIFDASGDAQAAWKILLPGPGGRNDLYGTQRFTAPDAAQLRGWLASIVGPDQAAELAEAVDAQPPHQASWVRQGTE